MILAIADRSAAVAGFILEQKLTGVGGETVAAAGERIALGAPDHESGKGAVYVYRYDSGAMRLSRNT